jgi:hypothetical protein
MSIAIQGEEAKPLKSESKRLTHLIGVAAVAIVPVGVLRLVYPPHSKGVGF